jgi:hypothetical protein
MHGGDVEDADCDDTEQRYVQGIIERIQPTATPWRRGKVQNEQQNDNNRNDQHFATVLFHVASIQKKFSTISIAALIAIPRRADFRL